MRLRPRNVLLVAVCLALCAWSSALQAEGPTPERADAGADAPKAEPSPDQSALASLSQRIEALDKDIKALDRHAEELESDKTLTAEQTKPYKALLAAQGDKVKAIGEKIKGLLQRADSKTEDKGLPGEITAVDTDLKAVESTVGIAAALAAPFRRIEALGENIELLDDRVTELRAKRTLTARQAEPYKTLLTAQREGLRLLGETAKALFQRADGSAEQGDLATVDTDLKTLESQVTKLIGEIDVLVEDKAWNDVLNALPARIEKLEALVSGLIGRVAKVKGSNTITGKQAEQYVGVLEAQSAQLKVAKPLVTELEKRRLLAVAEQGDLGADVTRADQQLSAIDATLKPLTEQLADLAADKGWSLVDTLLAARCATAICFANGDRPYWLGIEPLVELPVGISSAMGNTGLAEYINNHELSIDLAAGLRVWLFDDIISVSLYLSKALIDSSVRIEGSSFVYPGTAVRRSFPGIAVGLFFDSIWIGFDRNELRNGDSDNPMAFNPDFPPNVVVSSAWTFTVALQPITAFRTALGTANKIAEED